MRGSAVATAAAMTAPAWLPRVVLASSMASNRDVLISLYLRGGIDGLTLCAPHGDANYYAYRPTIAVPPPSSGSSNKAIDLDGYFGLPRQLQPLMGAYQQGDLLLVHATGAIPGNWTRSHFDAQRWMETGKPQDITLMSGWLGRYLAESAPTDSGAGLRAITFARGLPMSMVGGPNTLPVPDPSDFKFANTWTNWQELLSFHHKSYDAMSGAVRESARTTEATLAILNAIDFVNYQPGGGAVYPDSELGRAMRASAALIRANVGAEAIAIDATGFDTHSNQLLDGRMGQLLMDIGASLGAFYADLSAAGRTDYTLVAMSEFGRTARENASKGTDHGTANAMMLMGPNVVGGRVFSDWPGLAAGQLFETQDLKVTTDYRDVLSEIVSKRLDGSTLPQVFPDYTPTFHGLLS